MPASGPIAPARTPRLSAAPPILHPRRVERIAALPRLHPTARVPRVAPCKVRADTDRHDPAPQTAGPLALTLGLSRPCRDDLRQLAAGMDVQDALCRWARDGRDKGHHWPAGPAA